MSTRSLIAKKTSEGYEGIYCHWDGYPSHHMPILTEHYNTSEKVDKLLENGSLSSLHEKCDKPEGHSFDHPIDGYCVYYGRDRGEEEVDKTATKCISKNHLINTLGSWCEYLYIFENDKWTVEQLLR